MKDKLLYQLMKSYRFNRLSKHERAVELADYEYQKRNFGSLSAIRHERNEDGKRMRI